MGEMEMFLALIKLFNQYGMTSVGVAFMFMLWKNQKALGEKLSLLFRAILIRKAGRRSISSQDIKNHPYFKKIDNHLISTVFTNVEEGGSSLDFKMYVSDVASFVNHYLYREHVKAYFEAGRFDRIETVFPLLLQGFSKDCDEAVGLCLNAEILNVYRKATENVRGSYFEFVQTIISSGKLEPNDKAYLVLDLLTQRINSSHTILYKIFLEMNGKIESQAGLCPIHGKAKVEHILSQFKKD